MTQSSSLGKQVFLLIGRNAWLTQQIILNSTTKIPGTILIKVLL